MKDTGWIWAGTNVVGKSNVDNDDNIIIDDPKTGMSYVWNLSSLNYQKSNKKIPDSFLVVREQDNRKKRLRKRGFYLRTDFKYAGQKRECISISNNMS